MTKLSAFPVLLLFFLAACTTAINFQISFDSNGGSIVEPITINGESSFTEPNDPTKVGFIFAGWYFDNLDFKNAFT